MTIDPSRGRSRLLASACALFLLSACGDSDKLDTDEPAEETAEEQDHDAAQEDEEQPPTDELDAGRDGGSSADAGTDAGSDAGNSETVIVTEISATGHDRYYGVTYDKDGNIFAVGQTATTNLVGNADTGDYSVVLAKYSASGQLDKSFGSGGFATKNVVAVAAGPNREVGRSAVVQSTGKIVVGATVPHEPAGAGLLANDTDVALLRFNADGKLDTSFGSGGVKVLALTTAFSYQPPTLADGGVPNPALSATDQQFSLSLGADDKLVVFGVELGAGNKASDGTPRTDADWSLVRLTANGDFDTTFNGNGRVSLDIKEGGASARSATVLADGSIIGVGYTSVAGVLDTTTMNRQQPVLFKVKNDGSFDPTFATADQYAAKPGVFYDFVTPKMTNAEAYGAAPQGDKFISVGYGPTDGTGTGTDFIFARYNADGSHDKTFGTGGATYADPGGYGDNGRAIVVLPDNRVLGVGGGRAKPATPPAMGTNPPVDGMIAILKPEGTLDTSFGTNGMKLYDLKGPADFFWGAAVAPNKKSVAVVGIASAANDSGDDDAALVILELP